ncbi:MFS transporter [Flavobacterium sp. RHBU_3]|uniref:MFS transporter n=1 Tax=Flavobacterium sp. RHBU_3 TaxID=3391184 RepID=UPI003984D46E
MKLSLLPLALGGLTIGITEFVVMGLLPDIAKDIHVTIPQAGHLIAAYALGVVVGAPILVISGRNMPPKKMLTLLALMLAVFNALSIVAPGYNLLLASRFLSGLPHGAFFGVGAVVATRIAEKGKEARSVAIMFTGLTIANVVGVPLGTWIGHNLNWRYTFVIIAVTGLITVVSMVIYMPTLSQEHNAPMRQQLAFFSKFKAWLIIFITTIGFGGLFCWISYIAPLLTEVSGFAAEDVPYIMMLAGLGMVAGNLIGARLADRYSPAKILLALLMVMSATLTAVYFFSGNQYLSLVLVFFTPCMSFTLIAPINMLAIQTAVGAEMIASAALQAAFNMGNALGAYLGGLPLEQGYSYTSPNVVGVVMTLIGAAATALFIKITPASELAPSADKPVIMH